MMNPELRRNLWLEFSLHRMIAVPVLVALLTILIVAMEGNTALGNIAQAAMYGYAAAVLLWGTKRVGESVTDEVREHTWDAQRMSSISPWAMTWGKLAGAPSFAWYCGVILLALYVGVSVLAKAPVLRHVGLMLCGAILLHAVALNASVLAARKSASRRGVGIVVFLFLMMMWVLPGMGMLSHLSERTAWWGGSRELLSFVLMSVTAFGTWAVLGAYRSMCNELEIRTTPWALPAFIVFTAVYSAGFMPDHAYNKTTPFFVVMAMGAVLAMVFVYLLLFAEPGGAGVWQRLQAQVRDRQWHRALQELPLWLIALATSLVMAVAASVHGTSGTKWFGAAPIALTLFAVRDAAIFQFFALAREPRRVEAVTLFYLIMLYGLFPGLLNAIGAEAIAELVLPPLTDGAFFSTVVIGAQAAAVIALAVARWYRVHAPDVR